MTAEAFDIPSLLATPPDAFALIYRPQATGRREVELLRGVAGQTHALHDLNAPPDQREVLAMIPYRQLTELGLPCHDDKEPILTIAVDQRTSGTVDDAVAAIAPRAEGLEDVRFDIDDDKYTEIVRRVLDTEIATGEGSNFVIHRDLTAQLVGDPLRRAFGAFRQLLLTEPGAYWIFLIHIAGRTFVGASPERHLSRRDGVATMNPISGTYRYPPGGPRLDELVEFLADPKEIDELYMVVDEELKLMTQVCRQGAWIRGPYLKQMSHLAHTEYLIEGHAPDSPADMLRDTMFAPTVVGSPLHNALRVIARHETRPRGYYSGVAALIGSEDTDLDSAILIRTADIRGGGDLRIGVGATLVRGSTTQREVSETHGKAAGMLAAFQPDTATIADRAAPATAALDAHPVVRRALRDRDTGISRYWRTPKPPRAPASEQAASTGPLAGCRGLLIEAEDTFTSMLSCQLSSLGADLTIRRYDAPLSSTRFDFVVVGPGPGDPRDLAHPKIRSMERAVRGMLDTRTPMLAVCLGHQILAGVLGLRLDKLPRPHQGTQTEIQLFGQARRVGFYNSFTAVTPSDSLKHPAIPSPIELSADPATGHVHALRGNRIAGMQFHPESVLTQDGPEILTDFMCSVLPDTVTSDPLTTESYRQP